MKRMKTFPVIALLLVMGLAACVPATAVPVQQTPLNNQTAQPPTAMPLPSTTFVVPTLAPSATPQQVPQTGGTSTAPAPGSVDTYAGLLAALSNMSFLTVQQQGIVQQPYFNVKAQLLTINGQQVQVFEFNSVSDREDAQNMISSTGNAIGGYLPNFVSTPHFWSSGRLLVLYVGQQDAVIGALNKVLGPQINNPLGVSGTPAAAQQIITMAQRYLSNTLGIDISQVQLVSVQSEQWPDACLGLPQANETCAQVITPGYQVLLRVNGQLYQVRTDATGQQVRVTQGQSQ